MLTLGDDRLEGPGLDAVGDVAAFQAGGGLLGVGLVVEGDVEAVRWQPVAEDRVEAVFGLNAPEKAAPPSMTPAIVRRATVPVRGSRISTVPPTSTG